MDEPEDGKKKGSKQLTADTFRAMSPSKVITPFYDPADGKLKYVSVFDWLKEERRYCDSSFLPIPLRGEQVLDMLKEQEIAEETLKELFLLIVKKRVNKDE